MPEVFTRRILPLLVGGVLAMPTSVVAQIPAFSGADGAAANVTGGRGGIVYRVTKLDKNFNHNEPGTLRYGLTDSNFGGQARTIVFDVAGTFWLGRFGAERGHHNGWDTQSRINLGSNITIAGQTAPGPVYIMGGVVKAGSNNVILRNVSIAPGYGMRSFEKPDENPPELPTPGDFPDSYVYDAIDISGTNIMIDHVSTFYATDETISANELANNITIQYSNISQGQNYPQLNAEGGSYTGHAFGSLLQAGSNATISVHHNLYAHQKGRLPRVGSEVGTGAYNDFRNNVFYNWLSTAGAGSDDQPSFNNFVGNYYLAGPGGDDPQGGTSTAIVNRAGGTGIFSGASSTVTRVHHTGNVKDTDKDGIAEFTTNLTNSDFGSSSFQASPQWSDGLATYKGVTQSASAAYDYVLRYMGANWSSRDYDYTLGNTAAINTPDERMIHEVSHGTGKIMAWADDPFNSDINEGAEWRNLLSYRADTVTGAAPFNHLPNRDLDGDGMPYDFEIAHGLNPAVADHNGDFDSDGYTNLEEYINDIAAWPAPMPVRFSAATNNRYAQITNWNVNPDAVGDGFWQPSKYDTAIIDNGAVIVDAVGQHAGNLLLGTNAGNNATLNITSGWLIVEDAPHGLSDGITVIGDHASATATLNLSGGMLVTKTLLKGAGDTFNFTGGVLSAQTINFSLENFGGTLAPGTSPGSTTINGSYTTHSGELEIELADGAFDSVTATGSVTLGGDLIVKLLDGFVPQNNDSFAIITGSTTSGTFANVAPNGRVDIDGADGSFLVTVDAGQVTLSDFYIVPPAFAGDYDGNGVVDAADYVMWRHQLETAGELQNETASLGDIDDEDYNEWLAHFAAEQGGGGANAAAPEPSALLLVIVAFGLIAVCGRRL